MNKQNLLSRAEMKKVMGGNVPMDEIDGEGGLFCRFKYRDSSSGSWSNWSEYVPTTYSSCNEACLAFI